MGFHRSHISILELQAVFNALKAFHPSIIGKRVLICSDNSTVVSYINRQGGTHSPRLCLLTRQIFLWAKDYGIDLQATHIPGVDNSMADALSQGKVLNSELKRLYTAITRARVNIWIFDEDETKRGPMFELFQCLRLVKGIGPDTKQDDEDSKVDSMFAEKSSTVEWVQQGHYFFENKLWKMAAKCYQHGGDEKNELLARAHHQAVEAEHMRDKGHAMREKFLLAASLFLKCGSSSMAVNCLYNAREFALLAQLLEKQGKFSKAAKIYEKRLNCVSDACRCLVLMKDYAKALDLLCSVGLHTKALKVISQFKRFEQELKQKGKPLPRHVKPPESIHTLSELMFKSAEYHCRNEALDKMLDALKQLEKFEARVDFLRNRGLLEEAVKMLKDAGRPLDAAKIRREQGKLKEACTILESSNHPEFVAECRLSQARKLVLELDNTDGQTTAISLLTEAESLFARCSDSFGKSETQLLLGQLKKETTKIREAKNAFNRMSHTAAESECTYQLIKISRQYAAPVPPLKKLLELICAMLACENPEEKRQRQLCEEFFGLAPVEDGKLHIQKCEGARVLSALDKSLSQANDVEAWKAREAIAKCCLIPRALEWVKGARDHLHEQVKKLTQCSDYVIGMPCSKSAGTCKELHEPYKLYQLEGQIHCLVQLIQINDIIQKASKLSSFESTCELMKEIKHSQEESAMNCKALYEVFFPKHCHQRLIGDTAQTTQKLLKLLQNPEIKSQLKAFIENKRKKADPKSVRAGTDLYLMCHGIYLLIGEGTEVIENWVTQEECYCLKWQQREGWNQSQPLGMRLLNNEEPLKRFLSYKRYHLNSFESLFKSRDAMESLSSFNRFMGTLANKPRAPLLPSISNTVAMIEAKVTMMLALGAKIQQCTVAIPASYLAQAGFQDAVCCPGQGHAMYSAVSNSAVNKHTPGQTCRLVSLICGTTRSGRDFNVLADAFSSVEYIQTGEAERTLVVVLVMLCSAGLALPAKIIRVIREALQSITPSEQHLPKRVHTALCNINKAQSRHDALQVLEKLLTAREKEYLRECTWNTHMPPLGAPGLEFRKLNIKLFKNMQFEPLDALMTPTVLTELAEGNFCQRGRDFKRKDEGVAREGEGCGDDSEEEGELCLEVSKEEAAKVQRKQETMQREGAAKVIMRVLKASRLLRLAGLLRSRGHTTISVKPEVEVQLETTADSWVSSQLFDFQPIPSQCTICSENLQLVQEARFELNDPDEGGQDRTAAAGEGDSVETDHELQPEALSKDLLTQEEHEATESHKQRHQEFLEYKCLLRDKVYPLVTEVDKFLQELHSPCQAGEKSEDWNNFTYFKENLSTYKKELTDKMAEMQRERAFGRLSEIRHAVQQLEMEYETSKRKWEQRAAKQQDSWDSDVELADTMTFEEEADEKVLPVPNRQKGGQSKFTGSRKKRKHGKGRGRKR
ncbi:TPR and ankyrin repeat-containing protein 1-like [Acanthaster planci]|uniref:TPR and ankyrin repeat-containing protein 1-like n=1 Tax=Acanthaster planci TaxID=133434 RepID=A0A8B7ZTL5_ACAPL|nr:TPR and ankyrin repeat-containing protein 1-like [Acanthaster planci]